MLTFGALSFAVPWLLAALVTLPVLWWLLRAVPPAPSRVAFPAIRLLFGLPQHEETPHRTPWWLLALRLILAALVILALAHPVLDPGRVLRGSGPLILVIDNDWSAGADWDLRRETALGLIDEADRENRTVYIATSARSELARRPALQPLAAAAARDRIRNLAPAPWESDHDAVLSQIESLDLEGSANAVWLSSGLAERAGDPDTGSSGRSPSNLLGSALQRLGSLRIIQPAPVDMPFVLAGSENATDGLRIQVSRSHGEAPRELALIASDEAGRLLARETARFAVDAESIEVTIPLPSELRNRITWVSVEGHGTAGSTLLFDESSRRRPVGLVSGDIAQVDQPCSATPSI